VAATVTDYFVAEWRRIGAATVNRFFVMGKSRPQAHQVVIYVIPNAKRRNPVRRGNIFRREASDYGILHCIRFAHCVQNDIILPVRRRTNLPGNRKTDKT